MTRRRAWLVVAGLASLLLPAAGARSEGPDDTPRAREAFAYLHRVATHPRCVNCHGLSGGVRTPRVGDQMQAHPMNITCVHNPPGAHGDREACAKDNQKPPGLVCTSCHGVANRPDAGAPPGAPGPWQMPTDEVFALWPGMPVDDLCRSWLAGIRLKSNPRAPVADALVDHVSTDPLIKWAFAPNSDQALCPACREKPPGDQAKLVAEMAVWGRWIDAGHTCAELAR